MVRCTYEQTLPASANEVWAVFSRFGEIDWLPGPERVETSGTGVGMTRFLHIPGLEAPIEETLESLDEANQRFSYRVKKNPFVPYNRYQATVGVEAADAGCLVKFESHLRTGPGGHGGRSQPGGGRTGGPAGRERFLPNDGECAGRGVSSGQSNRNASDEE